jgi:hypothetical protein
MSETRIEIGDYVKVNFLENAGEASWIQGAVVGLPGGPGDAWKIRTDDGTLWYVQVYESIWRMEEPDHE